LYQRNTSPEAALTASERLVFTAENLSPLLQALATGILYIFNPRRLRVSQKHHLRLISISKDWRKMAEDIEVTQVKNWRSIVTLIGFVFTSK
jgi:hypothetical protein